MTAATADIDRWRAAVARYSRLRWVGMILFGLAAVVAGWHLALVVTAGMSGWKLLPCLLGLGLSLGAFGAADDTALFAMQQLQRAGQLDDARELDAERARRPDRLGRVHDSPKAALVLPLVALSIVAFLGARAANWEPPAGEAVEALP